MLGFPAAKPTVKQATMTASSRRSPDPSPEPPTSNTAGVSIFDETVIEAIYRTCYPLAEQRNSFNRTTVSYLLHKSEPALIKALLTDLRLRCGEASDDCATEKIQAAIDGLARTYGVEV